MLTWTLSPILDHLSVNRTVMVFLSAVRSAATTLAGGGAGAHDREQLSCSCRSSLPDRPSDGHSVRCL